MIVGVLKALFTIDSSQYTAGIKNMESSTGRAEKSIKSASRSLIGLKAKLIGAGIAAVALGMKLSKAAREVEAIDHKLRFATGSTEAANEAFEYLRDDAQRLGVSLRVLAGEYANFVAASKSANMTTEEVRSIFTAMSEAAAVLRMDVTTTKLAFKALSQMMSKGVVMSEELKRQLGDHLPGAAQIMAKTLGVSVREMNKMMMTSGLLSSEVLPMFAKVLHEEVAPGLELLDKSLAAATGRMQTAWFEFQRLFLGEDSLVTQSLILMTNTATGFMDAITKGFDTGSLLAGTVAELDRLNTVFEEKTEELVKIEEEKEEKLYQVDFDGMQKRLTLQQTIFNKEKALFEERNSEIIGFFENTLDTTLSLMQDWATGGKISFKDFTDSILKDMMKIVFQALVVKPLMDSLRGFLDVSEQGSNLGTGGPRGSAGGFFSALFGFLGNAIGGGDVKAYASGGVISEPISGIGLSSGSKYMFGEAGAEAVVPLSKGGQTEGKATNINVNINAIDSQSLTELMRDNPQAVTIPIIDAMQGGDRGLTAAMRGAL
jgi:tape measure domain-containing protein